MATDNMDIELLLFAIQRCGGVGVETSKLPISSVSKVVTKAKEAGFVAERKEKRDAVTADGKPKYKKDGKRSQTTVKLYDLTEQGKAHLASLMGGDEAEALSAAVAGAVDSVLDKYRDELFTAVHKQVAAELREPATGPGEQRPASAAPAPAASNGKPGTLEGDMRRAWDVLRYYPDALGDYVEIPKVYHELRKRHRNLSVEEFHQRLRKLQEQRTVSFSYANSPSNVTEPNLGFRERDKLVYYLRFTDDGGAA